MSATPWLKPTGVLDPEKHGRIIQALDKYASDANIPVACLWKALPKGISELERKWITKYPTHRDNGYSGLLITGVAPKIDPLARMGAIAGCLIRNYTRARVYSLSDVLAYEGDGSPVTATCLLIPDFIPNKKQGKELPAWRIQQITSLLMRRWSDSKMQTVLYAPSIDAIREEYGTYVGSLITNHYMEAVVA